MFVIVSHTFSSLRADGSRILEEQQHTRTHARTHAHASAHTRATQTNKRLCAGYNADFRMSLYFLSDRYLFIDLIWFFFCSTFYGISLTRSTFHGFQTSKRTPKSEQNVGNESDYPTTNVSTHSVPTLCTICTNRPLVSYFHDTTTTRVLSIGIDKLVRPQALFTPTRMTERKSC